MDISDEKVRQLKKILSPDDLREIIRIRNAKKKKPTVQKKRLNESFQPENLTRFLSFFDSQDRKMICDVISIIAEGPEQTGDEVFGDVLTEIKNTFSEVHSTIFDRDEDVDENQNQ